MPISWPTRSSSGVFEVPSWISSSRMLSAPLPAGQMRQSEDQRPEAISGRWRPRGTADTACQLATRNGLAGNVSRCAFCRSAKRRGRIRLNLGTARDNSPSIWPGHHQYSVGVLPEHGMPSQTFYRTNVREWGRLVRVNTHSTAFAPDAPARRWSELADVDLLRTLVETERRQRRLGAAMVAAVAEAEPGCGTVDLKVFPARFAEPGSAGVEAAGRHSR